MKSVLPASTHQVLIYIPSYDCEATIIDVLDEIPAEVWAQADVMIVDNQSQDSTVQKVNQANAQKRWPSQVAIVQPEVNEGYSGSQKLAYRLMLEQPRYKAILMLHGDGQYDPRLIPKFLEELDSPAQVVYGFRSKMNYFRKDETPIFAYLTIKLLSLYESILTGYWRREWHSGMVMHKRGFLERVNFANITRTMHIDGHLLFACGKLGLPIKGVPIYKRYIGYEALKPTARVRYVFHVLKLIPRLHFIPIAKEKTAIEPAHARA